VDAVRPAPRDALAYRAGSLGASVISAALGLVVAVRRWTLLGPSIEGHGATLPAPLWPVVIAPLLLLLGGAMLFAFRSPYSGAVVLWLGGLVAGVVFLVGPATGTITETIWAASVIASGVAAGIAIGYVHQALVTDQARRPSVEEAVPADLAVFAGILAWIGAALLGIHALNAAASLGSNQFAAEALIVLALLSGGASAIGGGLVVVSLQWDTATGDGRAVKGIAIMLLLMVVGAALVQAISWLPWSVAVSSACCVGHQFD
jgi:hypothetical protein